jgi:hypothetical protein
MEAVVTEGVEDFGFDERELLALLLARGKGAGAVEVAVADDATAGVQLYGPVTLHGVLGVSCREQGFDDAGGAGRLLRQAAGRAAWVQWCEHEGAAQLVGWDVDGCARGVWAFVEPGARRRGR